MVTKFFDKRYDKILISAKYFYCFLLVTYKFKGLSNLKDYVNIFLKYISTPQKFKT